MPCSSGALATGPAPQRGVKVEPGVSTGCSREVPSRDCRATSQATPDLAVVTGGSRTPSEARQSQREWSARLRRGVTAQYVWSPPSPQTERPGEGRVTVYHSVHCCSVRSEAAEEARTGSIRCRRWGVGGGARQVRLLTWWTPSPGVLVNQSHACRLRHQRTMKDPRGR